jgi:hypothetical protein
MGKEFNFPAVEQFWTIDQNSCVAFGGKVEKDWFATKQSELNAER